jgi:hypothetical protein
MQRAGRSELANHVSVANSCRDHPQVQSMTHAAAAIAVHAHVDGSICTSARLTPACHYFAAPVILDT